MHTRDPHPPDRQLTFGHLVVAERERPRTPFAGHRRARHRRNMAAIDDTRNRGSTAHRTAFESLCSLLDDFVGRLGVHESFQSVDFLNWLDRMGQRPTAIDPRAIGGAVKRLANAGVIVQVGVRPNGGGARHNSSQRPVYRVECLPSEARKGAAA